MSYRVALHLFALLAWLLLSSAAGAQQAQPIPAAAPPDTAAVVVPPEPPPEPSLDEQLRSLVDSIERKQRELTELRARLRREPGPELEKEIETTRTQLADLREQFVGLSTNDFSISSYSDPPTLDINWQEDLVQIIYPLLREMRQLTEKPRAIEKLRAQILFYRQNRDGLAAALDHLRTVQEGATDAKLARPLKVLREQLQDQHTDMEQKLAGLEHRLEDLERDTEPLLTSIGSGAKKFLTSVGLHLGLAVLIAVAVYYLLQLLGRLPLRLLRLRDPERLAFIERVVEFSMQLLGWLLALIAFVMVLYALDSWVMLGLAVIVMLGLLFGLKESLPNYLVEIRTLFNLGSIRQGERIFYNGLPWRVATLDVYTVLHNPALDGLLRVPLTQISRLSSRPWHREEPWFPSQQGEWLLLNDGVFGRVVVQTPEIVQINFGESIITYSTEAFLAARPQNLSRGFPVGVDFGIDYSHQGEATTSILERFRAEMQAALTRTDFGPHCQHFNIEFKSSNASSLDFRIMGTFRGEAADSYWRIQRWMQSSALDCANKFGWVIPFQQIVVHHAPEGALPLPEAKPQEPPEDG